MSGITAPIRRPVRVLLVAPSLGILGGQAVQAAALLAGLRSDPGVHADFLPINPPFPAPFGPLRRVKYLRTVLNTLLYTASLLRLRRYDVVHVFSASYYSFLLAPTPVLLAARLWRKPVVLHYHSGEAEDHLARWKSAIPLIRLAAAVAVPSRYLVDVFDRFGLPARPIFNLVELDRFPFRARGSLRPVFLSNRNLEPMYNVACVLRAFAEIQRRYPEARLTVAGDGSQRRSLEALAEQLGLRQVEFVGRVSPERMPELYRAADIYLNASEIDNLPGSIIEAWAAGLPVVTSNAGGIPYLVEHGQTGLMVACGDHAALASQALRLLDDPELAAGLSRRARRQAEQFTWDTVGSQWLELDRELSGGRRHRAASAAEPASAHSPSAST